MATSMSPYDQWLADKLLSLNPEVDTDVFVMYISSMLEEDSPADEKRESILELLAEVLETDRELACDEIMKKYDEINNKHTNKNTESAQKNIADQLSNMLEKQTIEPVKVKDTPTDKAEDRARKEAILAQYSNVSDEEDDDGHSSHTGTKGGGGGAAASGAASGASGDSLLMKNTNAETVGQVEKEKREKAKEESDKKKEKDKQDRAQQKQKGVDRKDAEKKRTQKGERRR
ncbi:coiled-coil domain-containing protein 43-like [Mizuhopecten yessoensis]|uniref:Coiled-coil domain-containing protein 43 n=1 Tax=Mizuhopecten yessoensis TaxID=6573 RepID=A0A210QSI1_MIZYE|nr:coiled-coil domain-containing protein 43-like [Mizuhopecten yessoensis]OWF51689.1 Coiled-coil domain-containing protein 43 [Mizuhopecten yessoensis]